MTDQHYPYPDGDFTVLGPGVFASSDGKTINWRGENYVRQEARTTPDVQGRCPACNGESLMLADGGFITCRRHDCPDPEAAQRAIEEASGADRDRDMQVLADEVTRLSAVTGQLRALAERWQATVHWVDDQPQEQPAARHDDGPSVEEAAKIDRNWDVEKSGE